MISAFVGRRFGTVFPLSRTAVAIDFHPHNAAYLFINFDPKVRKIYLIRRRLKELQRSSVHSSPFVIQMRKLFAGRELSSISLDGGVSLTFELVDANKPEKLFLVVQLGGSTSNLFIVDSVGTIIHTARATSIEGQIPGEVYRTPANDTDRDRGQNALRSMNGRSLSDILDEEEQAANKDARFSALAAAASRKIAADLKKYQRLLKNLAEDLAGHGNADEWKRFGELILANIATFRRVGDTIIVTDYYDPEMGEIMIPADRNQPPTEVAEAYFKRYTKARNGAAAISARVEGVNIEIAKLEEQRKRLRSAIEAGDEQAVADFLPEKKSEPIAGKKKEPANEFKGARKFESADGYEILVGKKAKDNDFLTFRVARSFDLWLHAADYPGSHVIIRNPNRKEIPISTLIEAARLAAFYSDAREKPKAAVNYTPKKFVNKPKRSAPGLVSLASFKTVLVEPKILPGSKVPS